MKERKLHVYICEYCNQLYDDEKEAEECEKSHLLEPRIIGKRYDDKLSYRYIRGKEKERYPHTLMIKFENDQKVMYHIEKIIDEQGE